MRWIMHVVDRVRDWSTRSKRRADEAMRKADKTEDDIDRIAGEVSGGVVVLRAELDKLATALRRRGH